MRSFIFLFAAVFVCTSLFADHLYELQTDAVQKGKAEFGHWGWDREAYMRWGSHSNRLIPVYTFGTKNAGAGIDLVSYMHEQSAYRNAATLKSLYGRLPEQTLNPTANYMDQTDIYRIQQAALKAGKKHIILVVFDGMDWQTTQAASIAKLNRIAYQSGRGTGFYFQDYNAAGTTQYAAMVTAPYVDEVNLDVNTQTVSADTKSTFGGYAFELAGVHPWDQPRFPEYLLGRTNEGGLVHAYPDSASSGTSMTAGIKTYNASINVDLAGRQVPTIAHLAQKLGYKIGVVTSVPISHATPAAAYAHNVKRHDYQDLTNDLLGVRSISHPEQALPGVDVLIGAGFGEQRSKDSGQGQNYMAGNSYLTPETLQKIDVRNGGEYIVAMRQVGVNGSEQLHVKTEEAIQQKKKLFGFFGVANGHLPFRTADGAYNPPIGRTKKAETYSPEDLAENPVLSEMTAAALTVLAQNEAGFWLMVEAGDVDWANHDNNIDNSAGAVISGDEAVKTICDWVEKNSSWDETVMIVTADHGHFLVLEKPELLVTPEK